MEQLKVGACLHAHASTGQHLMDDLQDSQAHFIHAFSAPLTSMRGALDLLRHPLRMPVDPVTRELIETLERSCARLRVNIETLLNYSRLSGNMIEMAVPLDIFLPTTEPTAPGPSVPPPTTLKYTPLLPVDPVSTLDISESNGRMLVIGEHKLYGSMIDTTLRADGYSVRAVAAGDLGIDIAREWRPDLIILDLDLPLPGALQVAQVLREDPETKTIPMVFAVGSESPPKHLPLHAELLPSGAQPGTLSRLVTQMVLVSRVRAEQSPTLLIVDDDADIRRILSIRLQQDGCRVVEAGTGAEALIEAQKQIFDLIILDLLLPDIDGFSVLGALRARTATALTPIILLSARDSAPEKVRGLQLGADDYVTKPFSPAELQARVLAALRRHEREAGANPSTRLPGNIAIERALRNHIQNHAACAICYADIDNFKAYNDTYSFLKGDAVIQQTAHVLLQAIEQCGNHDDFAGHIGGDDFVVITTPDRAERISAHAIAHFDMLAPLFYDAETRQRGFIEATDRQGRPALFPFVSLSIGIVSTDRHPIEHVAEVAQRSVEPKKRAKELPGSVYVIED